MNTKKIQTVVTIIFVAILTLPLYLGANNIQIDNISLTGQDITNEYTLIQFDTSWDNSWRISEGPSNWDAAWVFAKWKLSSVADWAHCTIDTVDANHTAPSGSTIDAPNQGTKNGKPFTPGIFIYRSANGSGSVDWNDAKLQWNYGADGISDDAIVDVEVFAIEMVYVPEGTFHLYSGETGNLYCNFNSGNTISSEAALPEGAITWSMESTCCGAQNSDGTIGGCAALGANYPKGYKNIYCMRYQISQGQYADFLNTVTSIQASYRCYTYLGPGWNSRYMISGSYPIYSALRPDRACNFLSWRDGLAYADWAGLRPMTELEYEKICRGPESAGIEFAWGNFTYITAAVAISGVEDGTEIITNLGANCCYGNQTFYGGDGSSGPLRCGIC